MSQEQPRKQSPKEPIKYGDVFSVEGELAEKAVAPRDAAMMQTAENAVTGQTQKGGAAAAMQSAARRNEAAGFVGHGDMSGAAGGSQGVSITESSSSNNKQPPAGRRTVTEAIGGQVIGQMNLRALPLGTSIQTQQGDGGGITIGEALEATALTAGNKPVEWSDAAAIQAAEVRATGRNTIIPGGVAASAQSAATLNARLTNDREKTTIADVLKDATKRLPADRPATRKDAEGVSGAEMRNDPFLTTHPAGVAASVAAAARVNQSNNKIKQ
ncbi:hypothetical protein Tsubulata_003739 [Turnera subulata]|uniref:SMP domain-containing protein n=1 Tax=Turnera subulata TaxID=218843 RepID=A0A9Q0JGQ0_9ROSI|nr:hypothetical protein Tsubulata_003739 [Turnera subulata]